MFQEAGGVAQFCWQGKLLPLTCENPLSSQNSRNLFLFVWDLPSYLTVMLLQFTFKQCDQGGLKWRRLRVQFALFRILEQEKEILIAHVSKPEKSLIGFRFQQSKLTLIFLCCHSEVCRQQQGFFTNIQQVQCDNWKIIPKLAKVSKASSKHYCPLQK